MILVSACLVGLNTKYNGKNNYNKRIFNLVKAGKAIPLCPEQLGGLSTPRIPTEIKYINGKRHIINKNGIDVTKEFEKGAEEVLNLIKKMNIKKAILQSRSPSCGFGKIYDGTFNNKLINGNGVLTELLIANGVEVITIDDYIDSLNINKK